jgi:hypothetical protein
VYKKLLMTPVTLMSRSEQVVTTRATATVL